MSGQQAGEGAGAALSSDRPVLRVISGNPTPDEIAAILALVAASSAPDAAVTASRGRDDGPGSLWADRERMLSRLPAHLPAAGPGAWRASMLPR